MNNDRYNRNAILRNELSQAAEGGKDCLPRTGLPDQEIAREIWPNAVLAVAGAFMLQQPDHKYVIFKSRQAAEDELLPKAKPGELAYVIIFDWSDPNPEKWPVKDVPMQERTAQ